MKLRGAPRITSDNVAVFRRELDPLEVVGTFLLFPDVAAISTKRLLWTRSAARRLTGLVRDASNLADKRKNKP